MAAERDRSYTSSIQVQGGKADTVNPDAKGLQALAHPMRGLILDILRRDGPATGAMLGRRLNLPSGSISWHLQKLAERGFIEVVPDRGKGRERWWRSVFESVRMHYAQAMDAGADEAAGATAFLKSSLSIWLVKAMQFLDEDWDFDWRFSAIFNNYDLVLDPTALEQLRTEHWAMIRRYMAKPSTSPEARVVTFSIQGYPNKPSASQDPAAAPPATDHGSTA